MTASETGLPDPDWCTICRAHLSPDFLDRCGACKRVFQPDLVASRIAAGYRVSPGLRAAGDGADPTVIREPEQTPSRWHWVRAAALGVALALLVGTLAFVILTAVFVGPAPASRSVSRAEFGAAWPLTVDSGVLSCGPYIDAVEFRAPDGNQYGLNSQATGAGLPAIDPIWANNPDPATRSSSPRMSMDPLLQAGLKLCPDWIPRSTLGS
jgi:Protein of unknown function (DUF2511)